MLPGSSTDVVLITGCNGFLGSSVVLKVLEFGYHVRATVRREEAINDVKRVASLGKYAAAGALTFHVIPDLASPGALVQATTGCTRVIHIAAPMPTKDLGNLVPATVDGTKAVLTAAEANLSVKRVVFTSSVYALKSYKKILPRRCGSTAALAGHSDKSAVMTAEDQVPDEPATQAGDPPLRRYIAAKVAARNEVLSYVASHASSHFSIVNLLPGYILGPDLLARRKADFFTSTNALLAFLFTEMDIHSFWGIPKDIDAPVFGEMASLDDCAVAHVKALDSQKVPGSLRNFLICTEAPHGARWADAADVIKDKLPEVARALPFASTLGTIRSNFQTNETERELLGRPLLPYSKIVEDTMKWWYCLPNE